MKFLLQVTFQPIDHFKSFLFEKLHRIGKNRSLRGFFFVQKWLWMDGNTDLVLYTIPKLLNNKRCVRLVWFEKFILFLQLWGKENNCRECSSINHPSNHLHMSEFVVMPFRGYGHGKKVYFPSFGNFHTNFSGAASIYWSKILVFLVFREN